MIEFLNLDFEFICRVFFGSLDKHEMGPFSNRYQTLFSQTFPFPNARLHYLLVTFLCSLKYRSINSYVYILRVIHQLSSTFFTIFSPIVDSYSLNLLLYIMLGKIRPSLLGKCRAMGIAVTIAYNTIYIIDCRCCCCKFILHRFGHL